MFLRAIIRLAFEVYETKNKVQVYMKKPIAFNHYSILYNKFSNLLYYQSKDNNISILSKNLIFLFHLLGMK